MTLALLRRAALAAMLIAAGIPPAAGQLTTGTLSGSVRDGQSAVIVGANASLISEEKGTRLPSVTSSASGELVIPNIPPGVYTLVVSLKGFKSLTRRGIAVSAGDQSGLGVLTLSSYWQSVITGALLLLVVVLQSRLARREQDLGA